MRQSSGKTIRSQRCCRASSTHRSIRPAFSSRAPTVGFIWASATRRGRERSCSTGSTASHSAPLAPGGEGSCRYDGLVRVTILPGCEVREVEAATVADVLRRLGLHSDAHLVVRGEDILTGDARLDEEDELRVYPVISGGRRAS